LTLAFSNFSSKCLGGIFFVYLYYLG
jgi:hypothetical protein